MGFIIDFSSVIAGPDWSPWILRRPRRAGLQCKRRPQGSLATTLHRVSHITCLTCHLCFRVIPECQVAQERLAPRYAVIRWLYSCHEHSTFQWKMDLSQGPKCFICALMTTCNLCSFIVKYTGFRLEQSCDMLQFQHCTFPISRCNVLIVVTGRPGGWWYTRKWWGSWRGCKCLWNFSLKVYLFMYGFVSQCSDSPCVRVLLVFLGSREFLGHLDLRCGK